MTGKGHFDQFPSTSPSAGCRLGQGTFAEAIRQLPRHAENGARGRSTPRRLKLSRRQADDRLLRLQFAIIIAPGNLRGCRGENYVPGFGLLADRTRMVSIRRRTSHREREVTMKAGVVYPQVELGGDTGAVKAFAQPAEGLGYDHVVIYDHGLGAVNAGREPKVTAPYKKTETFPEPL